MSDPICRYDETRALIDLVKYATELVRSKGEAAFAAACDGRKHSCR